MIDRPQVHGCYRVNQGHPTETKFGLLSTLFLKFAKRNHNSSSEF